MEDLPQRQARTLWRVHGAHGPTWHSAAQRWSPQSSPLPHTFLHDGGAVPHRRGEDSLPQKQAASTILGQGGQGPGWHSSLHVCPQEPNALSHLSPQVCADSHGSNGGSFSFLQKQRYSEGVSARPYAARHYKYRGGLFQSHKVHALDCHYRSNKHYSAIIFYVYISHHILHITYYSGRYAIFIYNIYIYSSFTGVHYLRAVPLSHRARLSGGPWEPARVQEQ